MTQTHDSEFRPKLRIGSRGSQLALWQSNHISALLRARGHEVEIEIIHTTGDKITDVALALVGTDVYKRQDLTGRPSSLRISIT